MADSDVARITTDSQAALDGLVRIARLIRADLTLDAFLEQIARTLVDAVGFGIAVVNMRRPADDDFIVATVAGNARAREELRDTTTSLAFWRHLDQPRFHRHGVLFAPAGAITFDDWDVTFSTPLPERRTELDDPWHPEDILVAPMLSSSGELLGFLSVDEPADGQRPDRAACEALAAVAAHVGVAVEQRQAHAREAEQSAALRELLAVAARMNDAPDRATALRMVCDATRDVLGFEEVAIAVREGERLRCASAHGSASRPFALELGEVEVLLEAAAEHDGTFLLTPEQAAALWRAPLPPPTPGAGPLAWGGHLLLVPLRESCGRLAGLLRVAAPRDRLLPGPDRRAALRMFAVQAGAILDSAARRALREERDRAVRAALEDALTGLPNRDALRTAVAARLDAGAGGSVLFLDLDDFKIVNDALGHQHGDQVLKEVAIRLRDAAAPWPVHRLGGDEFAVVADATEDAALEVAARLHAALDAPFLLAGAEHRFRASVGVAATEPELVVSDMLKRADIAMYQAKTVGPATVVYDAATDQAATRLATIAALRAAPERGELELHYQPLVKANDRRTVGVEALVRWRRDGVLVPPLEFIGLAESSGLIDRIGAWVLDEAAAQSRAWREQGLRVPPLGINVSPRELRGGALADRVATARARHRLPDEALVVEVTESGFTPDERVADELAALDRLGVLCCIDDFGADYSSLGRLLELQVGVLKVDRAFLRGVPHDARAVGLLHSIIAMATALGLIVVVEGVETEEQARELQGYGNDVVWQGFLAARPMPADAFAAWLADQEHVDTSPAEGGLDRHAA